jgi:hypothetical protein
LLFGDLHGRSYLGLIVAINDAYDRGTLLKQLKYRWSGSATRHERSRQLSG